MMQLRHNDQQDHHYMHHKNHEQQDHHQMHHENHEHNENNANCNHDAKSEHACVALVPIFNHLEEHQLDEIMHVTNSVLYKKGEVLYRANEKSDSLYIVSQGKIKIYRLSEGGKEQLVRILLPGNFTGELALFNESLHEAYAEAMEDTWVCKVKRADLQELLMKYPTIALKVLSEFSNRLGQSEKQTTRFATERVETRIALYLAECVDEDQKSYEFTLPMSKKDLASYLGTTPETISRKLFELEDAGLIRQKPRRVIEILDYEGLLLV